MSETIYAAFVDPYHAENAAGALLDHGVPASDISLVLSEEYQKRQGTTRDPELGYIQQTITAGSAGHTERFDPLGNDLRNSGEVQIGGGDLGPRSEAPESDLNPAQNDYPSVAAGTPTAFSSRPPDAETDFNRNLDTRDYNKDYTSEVDQETRSESAKDHRRMEAVPHGNPEPPVMQNAETGIPIYDADRAAKHGITVTTPADAAIGAAKGAGFGLGVGALAALAALAVPGFGLIIGGGVLATAIAGIAATTGAGAVAGGVFGFLKDQGVPAHDIPKYQEVYDEGGAILSVSVDSAVPRGEIEDVLKKYGAHLVDRYGYVA